MQRRIPKKETERARALRNNPTEQELTLWHLLSRYRPKFTRQLSLGAYKADLACRKAKLIVEVDGSQHADSKHDLKRTKHLEAEGWTVIRFWNSDVNTNPDSVAEPILLKAAECLGGTHPQPLPHREGRVRRSRRGPSS